MNEQPLLLLLGMIAIFSLIFAVVSSASVPFVLSWPCPGVALFCCGRVDVLLLSVHDVCHLLMPAGPAGDWSRLAWRHPHTRCRPPRASSRLACVRVFLVSLSPGRRAAFFIRRPRHWQVFGVITQLTYIVGTHELTGTGHPEHAERMKVCSRQQLVQDLS